MNTEWLQLNSIIETSLSISTQYLRMLISKNMQCQPFLGLTVRSLSDVGRLLEHQGWKRHVKPTSKLCVALNFSPLPVLFSFAVPFGFVFFGLPCLIFTLFSAGETTLLSLPVFLCTTYFGSMNIWLLLVFLFFFFFPKPRRFSSTPSP